MVKFYSLLPFVAIFFCIVFLDFALAHDKKHEATDLPSKYKGLFSRVYAFGDSYTDTGNAQLLGGLMNSGSSDFNPTKFGKAFSRLCDGRLVVDFLCEELSLPPLPPYKGKTLEFSHGVNFAVAGSTSLSSEYFTKGQIQTLIWKKTPLSFQSQINWFRKFQLNVGCKGMNETSCKAEMESTLFWIGAMGVNDYSRTIGLSFPFRFLAKRSVTQSSRLLKTLLDAGAKYIVVEGLPPMGCLSLGIAKSANAVRDHMGCIATVNSAVMIYNQILQMKLKYFQKMYPNSSISYADNWNAYLTILSHPTKYFFHETFKACCGAGEGELNFKSHLLCGAPGTSTCEDPSKYIIWDGIHLTEAMNRNLANLFLNQGFCKPSFSDLVKNKSGI